MLAAGWPHLHRDIVDVNKLHRCPHSPVHPQRWPEPTLHLGSESGGVLPLQEVHDKEEQRQEGGCEELLKECSLNVLTITTVTKKVTM